MSLQFSHVDPHSPLHTHKWSTRSYAYLEISSKT